MIKSAEIPILKSVRLTVRDGEMEIYGGNLYVFRKKKIRVSSKKNFVAVVNYFSAEKFLVDGVEVERSENYLWQIDGEKVRFTLPNGESKIVPETFKLEHFIKTPCFEHTDPILVKTPGKMKIFLESVRKLQNYEKIVDVEFAVADGRLDISYSTKHVQVWMSELVDSYGTTFKAKIDPENGRAMEDFFKGKTSFLMSSNDKYLLFSSDRESMLVLRSHSSRDVPIMYPGDRDYKYVDMKALKILISDPFYDKVHVKIDEHGAELVGEYTADACLTTEGELEFTVGREAMLKALSTKGKVIGIAIIDGYAIMKTDTGIQLLIVDYTNDGPDKQLD